MDTNVEDNQSKPEEKYDKGYGKRPLWQWILIYLITGTIIYGLIYYFFLKDITSISGY